MDQPGYTAAVRAGDWLFLSGHDAGDQRSGLVENARAQGLPFHSDPLARQGRQVLASIAQTLALDGAAFAHLVRLQQWLSAPEQDWRQGDPWTGLTVGGYVRELDRLIPTDRPTSVGVGVRRLLCTDGVAETDGIAIIGHDRQFIACPPDIPAPSGRYAPALVAGDWIFTSGEIATDWIGEFGAGGGDPYASGGVAKAALSNPNFWYQAPIEPQTHYVMEKLSKIVAAAGTDLNRCVQADVYLSDPRDFARFDEEWQHVFPTSPPARTVVPYSGLAARGCRIEVSLVLLARETGLSREYFNAPSRVPMGSEPSAVAAGDLLWISNLMAADESGLVHGLGPSSGYPFNKVAAVEQMTYVLRMLEELCVSAGSSLDNVLKCTLLMAHMSDFGVVFPVWREAFGSRPPALTVLEMGDPLLVPGCCFQMSGVAYMPSAK